MELDRLPPTNEFDRISKIFKHLELGRDQPPIILALYENNGSIEKSEANIPNFAKIVHADNLIGLNVYAEEARDDLLCLIYRGYGKDITIDMMGKPLSIPKAKLHTEITKYAPYLTSSRNKYRYIIITGDDNNVEMIQIPPNCKDMGKLKHIAIDINLEIEPQLHSAFQDKNLDIS